MPEYKETEKYFVGIRYKLNSFGMGGIVGQKPVACHYKEA